MSKKSVKNEQERIVDPKKEGLVVYEQRTETQKSIWDSIFNCQDRKESETCKKVRFKWVC
jgi:hypothetical protein